MLRLLLKAFADVAASFIAASAADADWSSVQVLILWLVQLVVAVAFKSYRLHAQP